jgi:membrane-bound lytic murein transglycosylase D
VGSLALLVAGVASAGEPPRPAKPVKPASSSKSAPRRSSRARATDSASRRSVAGGVPQDDLGSGAETEELRALREAEQEIFAPAVPAVGGRILPEIPALAPREIGPRVLATGVPPIEAPPFASADVSSDLSWLAGLEMPDLPIRWEPRVVEYLRFFRDDPRGHIMFANLFRHSGRFRALMQGELRQRNLPEDLVWVSMIESGFDPAARSASGAAGLWQFMPETGKIYGLTVDRWLDQRYSPELATAAAADLLGDLHRRFGSWELALAAYNMGYGGVSALVRRYNTNDFWALAGTEGTLPWQTTLYVPKILAASVVAHNLATFGFGDMLLDPPSGVDRVDVPAGYPLALVAQGAGCDAKEIEGLNPELRAARTPPAADGGAGMYAIKVPAGRGAALSKALARSRHAEAPVDRYVVRFGENLEQIAAAHKTTSQRLVELNAIAQGETLRGGTTLLVPKTEAQAPAALQVPVHGEPTSVPADERSTTPNGSSPAGAAPVPAKDTFVVPSDEFVYPDRRRVFYRVLVGDTPHEIARGLRVSIEDLYRWNGLDPSARLQEGMTLQAFVGADADLAKIVVVPEAAAHVVPVASEEFFAALEQTKKVRRVMVAAKDGDTLESIGARLGVASHTMEWINRRGRAEPLKAGESVVVYLPNRGPGADVVPSPPSAGPTDNGPLPAAPQPDLLP